MDMGEIIGIALGGTALLFNLMGRPAPLSTASLRRPFHYVQRKRAQRLDARKRETVRLEQEKAKRNYSRQSEFLFANCNRLREMQDGTKQFHSAEWKRQTRLCKESAIAMMQLNDVKYTTSSRTNGPILLPGPSGTILITHGHDDSHQGQLGVSVSWHPCPSLPRYYMFERESYGEPRELFTEWLTDVEAQEAGWEEHVSWIRS